VNPLLRLVRSLRTAGVPVSSSEVIDATWAFRSIDIGDRAQVRAALAATLVKRAEDRAAFDTLFDVHLAIRGRPASSSDGPRDADEAIASGSGRVIETSLDRPGGLDTAEPGDASTALLEALVDALRQGDLERLRELADLSVSRLGGMRGQPGASERYFLYRIMRALELSRLMADALRADRADAAGRGDDAFDDRQVRAELQARVEHFKRLLAEQVRRHMAELKGADEVARVSSHVALEEADFLGASPRELRAMREEIRPLARSLASRMHRRKRRRQAGRLDVRRTVRRSLSSGGVPIDPVFRRPRVSRPDLFLLCDVSGSVAEFASFTLTLLQAMTGEFSRLRSFAFVDGVDEVTGHLRDVASFLEVRHVLYRADVVRDDGHSDYGLVLERFAERYGSALDARSTVIITGDARSNGRPPRVEALREIAARARRVYLLDPEPIEEWDTLDSIVSVYRPHLAGVFEVRNLQQLGAAVLRIT
jgi:uncharacterized protein with von Willebrand factor type A (vWA) domain